MTAKLILNADDYGLTPGVSAGIRHAHLHGLVTSTTAMMNTPFVDRGLQQALQECPRLGTGVHLVLTTGRPLLPPRQVGSLVDQDGSFLGVSGLVPRIQTLDPDEIQAEWQAQVQKFVDLTGRLPDHLDAHHHIAYFTPGLFGALLNLAGELRCPIRLPVGDVAAEILGDLPPDFARECWQENLRLLQQLPVPHPDTFVHSFYADQATQEHLTALLQSLPGGSTEIMCHPAFVDPELSKVSIYLGEREQELAILTGTGLQGLLQDHQIQPVSFAQLGEDAGLENR